MKAGVAAAFALAMGMAAPASAVPVTFEFKSTAMTEYVGEATDPDAYWYVGQESFANATIVLDLDSIANLDYSAYWSGNRFRWNLEENISGALISASGSAGIGGMSAGFPDSLFGSIGIKTDARGALTAILLSVGDDTPDLTFWSNEMAWGDCCETWYRGPGEWTVSGIEAPAPVPLPASVAMLGLALAGLGFIRHTRR